jgi:hypothetical protein
VLSVGAGGKRNIMDKLDQLIIINLLIIAIQNIHTYHSFFILEGVAEASRIFLPDAHILPKLLATRNTADVTGGKHIAI